MTKSLMKRTRGLFRGRPRKDTDDTAEADTATDIPPMITEASDDESTMPPVLIVGAGIVGLVLALALDKHCDHKVELYEQAPAFVDDIGAGMGMYPNGLRVIRDISPDLLHKIQQAGYPYLLGRFERHDGTEVAIAEEKNLFDPDAQEDAEDLQPIGIRRWRLQKIRLEAVQEAGIQVHFNKRLDSLEQGVLSSSTIDKPDQVPVTSEDPMPLHQVRLNFTDGTSRATRLLLACDGSKSQVRKLISGGKYQLQHTGTTCLMGTSTVPRPTRGLSLPSSETTKCHGAFYPTGENEQCFQFHFPTALDEEESENDASTSHSVVNPKDASWGGLTHAVEQTECNKLADRLVEDGWDEKYIEPLRKVEKALKIGFGTLEPQLESFVFDHIVLVGDSAHPPVPYLGQGAQQGLEDAGTLALLLRHYCTRQRKPSLLASGYKSPSPRMMFSLANVATGLQLYNELRVPRTAEILNRGELWGKQQQKRAENKRYNEVREENIRRDVFYYETLPVLLPVVRHDYREDVKAAIEKLEGGEHKGKATALLLVHSDSQGPDSRGSSSGARAEQHHLLPVPEQTLCF